MLSGFTLLNQTGLLPFLKTNLLYGTYPGFQPYIGDSGMIAHSPDCNAAENNRFQGESQNLSREIFMARITILVYSIQLVTIRKATVYPQAVNNLIEGPPPLNC